MRGDSHPLVSLLPAPPPGSPTPYTPTTVLRRNWGGEGRHPHHKTPALLLQPLLWGDGGARHRSARLFPVPAPCPRGGRAGPQRPLARRARRPPTHYSRHTHSSRTRLAVRAPLQPTLPGGPSPIRAAPSRPQSHTYPLGGSPTGGLRCARGLGSPAGLGAGAAEAAGERRQLAAHLLPAGMAGGWRLTGGKAEQEKQGDPLLLSPS